MGEAQRSVSKPSQETVERRNRGGKEEEKRRKGGEKEELAKRKRVFDQGVC